MDVITGLLSKKFGGDLDNTILEYVVGIIHDDLETSKDFVSFDCWNMLLQYCIDSQLLSSKEEFVELKLELNQALLENGLVNSLYSLDEFSVGMLCEGFYEDEDAWYECRIIEISKPGEEYIVQYVGYEDENVLLNRDYLRKLPEKMKDAFKYSEPESDFEDPTVKIELEEVPDWVWTQLEEENGDHAALKSGACPMCERVVPLTFHHLRPRITHSKYVKQGFSKEQLLTTGIDVCRACHSQIHTLFSNEELAKSFYTLELLLENEKVQKWVKYISKQRPTKHGASDKRLLRLK